MTFARAKPTGWTDDVDSISATEINTIDVNQSNAVDGAAGGTYTPSADVSIASLKSPSLKETTVIESLILGTLGRLALSPTDVVITTSNVTIRDIDAGGAGTLFRVDDSGTSGGAKNLTVKANTTANLKDGEICIIFFQGAGVENVAILSESGGNNPLYTRTGGTGTDPEFVVLAFNTSLTGMNPDGEWELAMYGGS